jgi:hypothetical protein
MDKREHMAHAMNTECWMPDSGGRVSNAWATCLSLGDNTGKLVLIPHDIIWGISYDQRRDPVEDGPASD